MKDRKAASARNGAHASLGNLLVDILTDFLKKRLHRRAMTMDNKMPQLV